MKVVIGLIFLVSSMSSFACNIEVDGEQIKPQILELGSATITNENLDEVTLVTCGKFEGQVEGISRVAKLEAGECTIISNKNEISVFKCQK